MAFEVGEILEGKVSGITKFGAFVDLPGGKTGMVHISEVAQTYVKEISDFVKIGDTVKVKVVSLSPEGKIGLSMKKALPQTPKSNGGYKKPSPHTPKSNDGLKNPGRPGNFEWQNFKKSNEGATFEDMMTKFKQSSDEKISDLKRFNDGGGSRRSGRGSKNGGYSSR